MAHLAYFNLYLRLIVFTKKDTDMSFKLEEITDIFQLTEVKHLRTSNKKPIKIALKKQLTLSGHLMSHGSDNHGETQEKKKEKKAKEPSMNGLAKWHKKRNTSNLIRDTKKSKL